MTNLNGLSVDGSQTTPSSKIPTVEASTVAKPQIIYTFVDTEGSLEKELQPPPSFSARMFRLASYFICMLLLLNFTGYLSRWAHGYDSCFKSSCLHSYGGGHLRLSGDFLHFDPKCTFQLRRYFGVSPSSGSYPSPYMTEVHDVSSSALTLFRSLALATTPNRKQVIVFDIDETVLSNRFSFFPNNKPDFRVNKDMYLRGDVSEDEQISSYRMMGSDGGDNMRPRHRRSSQDSYSAQSLESVSSAASASDTVSFSSSMAASMPRQHPLKHSCMDKSPYAPALGPMLDVYRTLYAMNYSVAFLTGRSERDRNYTLANLQDAGFGSYCSAIGANASSSHIMTAAAATKVADAPSTPTPCFVALFMRENNDMRLASVYKPEKRGALVGAGFEIVGNFGDQFSDLVGPNSAPNNFKLPNPAYYII